MSDDDDDQSSIASMLDGSIPIPSVVDGLTPVQRMILIYAFKNPDCQQVKELIAWVDYDSDSPAYRNQQQLFTATMTAMAQNYPGTNNINLLNLSSGGVGNRYTCTQLSSITRHIFRDVDQPLAEYMTHNYYVDEYPPTWLMPVIPMVLVNGSQGICPKYDPHDIIANLRNLLSGKPFVPMAPLPRYKWFTREIPTSSYTARGIVEEERGHAPNTLFITELPIGMEAQDYEEFLKQAAGLKQTEPFIKEYIAHRDIINGTVTFKVVMSPDQMSKAQEEGFEKKFGLTTDLNTDNMHFLDANGVRKKYDTPEQIMKEFVDLRLKCYKERKSALFDIVENALLTLEEDLHTVFCDFRESALFPLYNPGDEVLYAWLKNNYSLPSIEPPTPTTTLEDVHDQSVDFFDTLLSLTYNLKTTRVTEIWLEELDDLEEQLNKRDQEDEANRRKKWICVEEDKPFSVSDSEGQPPKIQPPKIEDEEQFEVKCGSQVRPSSIPEDVSPPPVKREEEDETEKRKKCCWIPVVRKRSKTRTTLQSLLDRDRDGDGDGLRRSRRVPKRNRLFYGGDYVTK